MSRHEPSSLTTRGRRTARAREATAARRAVALVLLLTFATLGGTAPGAAAPAGNDAGTGADAPDSRDQAVEVPLGVLEGTMDYANGDREDWYRVDVGRGRGFAWQLGMSYDARIRVYDADGQRLQAVNYWLFGDWGESSEHRLVTPTDALIIRILHDGEGGRYRLNMRAWDLPALVLTRVDVPEPSNAFNGTRHVDVDVANEGAGPTVATVRVWVTHNGPSRDRAVGVIRVPLEPGARETVRVEWDARGQVGDVTVHARVTADTFELFTGDNVREARSHVLVHGTGAGVDALNNGAFVSGGPGVWTYHGGTGSGACVRYVLSALCRGV